MYFYLNIDDKSNLSLEEYAKAFVRDFKKNQMTSVNKKNVSQAESIKEKSSEKVTKDSVWNQFLSTDSHQRNAFIMYTIAQSQHVTSTAASFNRLLDNKTILLKPTNGEISKTKQSNSEGTLDGFVKEPKSYIHHLNIQ